MLAPLLSVLALGHCVTNDFAWDDTEYVLQNKAIRSFRNLPRFFGLSYWAREMPTTIRSYRPLREVSLAVDFALWGEKPAGYHLTSVLVHVLAVLCVYVLARRCLPGGRASAALAASVFAVHPSRVEVVALVENRAEIFAACLVLVSALCWTRAVEAQGRTRWAWYGSATAAFVLALASKAIAVALPLALVAAAWCLPRARGSGGRSDGLALVSKRKGWIRLCCFPAGSILLLFALAVGFVLWSLTLIEKEALALPRLSALPLAWRPALVAATFQSYLKMAFLPVNSHADRLLRIPGPPLCAWYAGLAGWALLLLMAAARRRVRTGPAAFGVAWFIVFLLPVLNCPVIEGRPLAEQRLYLPLAGLCLCVGFAVAGRAAWRAWVLWAIVAYSALSCRQVFVWADNRALWFDNVLKAPENSRARNNLGMEYTQWAGPHVAARELEAAFRLEPRDDATAANLAYVYQRQGMLDRAAAWFERAVRLRPNRAGRWRELAEVQCMRQQWPQAKHALESAIALEPRMVTAYNLLAAVYVALGQHAEAETVLKRALTLEPDNAGIHASLGQVYDHLGQHTKAVEACQRALRLDPMNPGARLLLKRMEEAGQDEDDP